MTSPFASRFVVRYSLAACLVLAAPACGTGSNNQPAQPNDQQSEPIDVPIATSPCKLEFGDACGAACSGDQECTAGLYCKDSICSADCLKSSDCKSGTCSESGRCVEGDNISLNPTMTDPGGRNEMPECIKGDVDFKPTAPQAWLLLDRSGSMSGSLGTTSRWLAMGNVLLGDPSTPSDRGVVGEFEDRVAFGVVFYTDGSGLNGCALDLESVALAANNYREIRQRYNKIGPTGGTPTADSVAATVAVAGSSDLTGGPKLLVLATDGAPGSCSRRTGVATTEVENEVAKAFAKHIKTFAISISTGTDVPHMQRVANLGVGLPAESPTPAPLYSADSQAALKTAFSTILEELPRSCVFSLNGRVQAGDANKGKVVLFGETLTYEDANGWTLKSPDQVELLGEACAAVQAADEELTEEDLDIEFPCLIIPPVE